MPTRREGLQKFKGGTVQHERRCDLQYLPARILKSYKNSRPGVGEESLKKAAVWS